MSHFISYIIYYFPKDTNFIGLFNKLRPGDGRMVGRCHLVLQSADSNPALGMDVCSRSESALSRRSQFNQPSCSKKQTVALQTKPTNCVTSCDSNLANAFPYISKSSIYKILLTYINLQSYFFYLQFDGSFIFVAILVLVLF